MRRLLATIVAISVAAAAAVAFAQYAEPLGPPVPVNDPAPDARAGHVVILAASSARLLAHVSRDGTLAGSKAVAAVTRVGVGEFCIKPSKGLNLSTVIPAVSVDYSDSLGVGNLAEWRSSGIDCPAGQIDIVTFASQSGGFSASDSVGFTVVVV